MQGSTHGCCQCHVALVLPRAWQHILCWSCVEHQAVHVSLSWLLQAPPGPFPDVWQQLGTALWASSGEGSDGSEELCRDGSEELCRCL